LIVFCIPAFIYLTGEFFGMYPFWKWILIVIMYYSKSIG
jgi:hypothetical protein